MSMTTTRSFIPYARQSIDARDIQEVGIALRDAIITRGDHVDAFEEALAEYAGAEYAVAFNSGSSALAAATYAAEISSADRMITPPNTFIATIGSGIQRGATPVFVDIDRSTGNLDLDQVECTLQQTPSLRGKTIIFPVHFAGIPVDMKRLDRMIRSPSTVVIEDAAHAIGSKYLDGQRVGCCAWSHMTVFSFHPAKTMTTGEGGAVLTNSAHLYDRLRSFRNNMIENDPTKLQADPSNHYSGYYEVLGISGNYNFTDFQAALGLSQLKRMEQFISKRQELIQAYRRLFKDFPQVKLLTPQEDSLIAFHLCVAQIDFAAFGVTKAQVMMDLKEQLIGTQVHYIPLYKHPFFKNSRGDLSEYFPQMESYFSEALSLPLYYDLRLEDVEYVVSTLKEILLQGRLLKERAKRKPIRRRSRH